MQSKIFKITMPYYMTLSASRYDFVLNHESYSLKTKKATQVCKYLGKEKCVVPYAEIHGTAFLDESPDFIWTNCHIITEWMQFAGQDQVFERSQEVIDFFATQNVPLVLKDANKNIVYSSEESAQLKVFSTQAEFPYVYSACNRRDDLVKIQLQRPLANEGIVWSREKPTDLLFIGGYPRPTDSREPLEKVDSNGESFYWTFGKSMDFKNPEDLLYLHQKPHLDLALSGTYSSGLLSDGVEGMSGAPVLNQLGEVVGIYRGFVPLSEEHADIPYVSLYINIQGMRFVEIFSGEK